MEKHKFIYIVPVDKNDYYIGESSNSKFKATGANLSFSGTAINKVLAMSNMLERIMPRVIGVSPNSKDINWAARLQDYFFSIDTWISVTGRKIDVGFIYNVDSSDETIAANIAKLAKGKPISNEELYEKCKLMDLEEIWKYAEPIVPEDYVLGLLCSLEGRVANSKEILVDKGLYGKCTHYLNDEAKAKQAKAKLARDKGSAVRVFSEIIIKPELVEQVLLYVNGVCATGEDSEDDNLIAIDAIYQKNPMSIVAASKDKNLATHARIRAYSNSGILRELPNSEIIVDGENPAIVIGNNMADCISWFNNELNKAAISEYEAKYKAKK